MVNTIADQVYRLKYYKNTIEVALRNMLVSEKICAVDRSDVKTIRNPYGTAPTTTVQALSGTYSVSDLTTTDDTLTVADEFISANHIKDFEDVLSNFDLFSNRVDELTYSVAAAIDKHVLNRLCEDGTGTYTTPAGGFTTAANIPTIIANLTAKVMGYADVYRGLFLVIENSDTVGFTIAQMTNGFSFADAALNNGFMTRFGGVDIYVVRDSTFASETSGSVSYTNSGHRVFGVKGVATYAAPRGVKIEEKMVTGKTGREVVVFGYVGFKLWTTKAGLVVDITIA